MIKEFRLPDLGEGLTESEILSWKVAVGDTVTLNQVIAEVETAKAVVELPSPFAGTVAALARAARFRGGGRQADRLLRSRTTPEPHLPVVPVPSGRLPARRPHVRRPQRNGSRTWWAMAPSSKRSGRPARRQRSFDGGPLSASPCGTRSRRRSWSVVEQPAPPVHASLQGRELGAAPRSTPPVRKLARDLGIDLSRSREPGRAA